MSVQRGRPPAPWKPKPRPAPRAIAGGMLALAADAAGQQRVASFSERVLGVTADAKPPASAVTREPPVSRQPKRRQRGLAVEGRYEGRGATAVLEAEGYRVQRPKNSEGAADLWAIKARPAISGAEVRLVQCKRLREFRADGLNDAVARYLGLGEWAKHGAFTVGLYTWRESWLWLDRHGWAARVYLFHDDSWMVEGERADPVRASVERMLAREAARPAPVSRLEERL